MRYGPLAGCRLGGFLGSLLPPCSARPGGLAVLSRLGSGAGFPWPPQRLHGYARYSVSARDFRFSVAPSPRRGAADFSPHVRRRAPHRARLRPRLTLIRLALIRNPWSYGGRVSRPPCRYLFPHLLFRSLQNPSRGPFCGAGMLPYRAPQRGTPTASAAGLCPCIIHAGPLD